MRRFLPLLAVPCVACGDEAVPRNPAVVRDSAGIHIVENTHPVWSAGAWHLGAEPTLTIGTLEGAEEYQLFNVTGATRLSDGRVVIANAGSFELKYYDPAGRFITAVGGPGEGPGEFGSHVSITALWEHAGDSVAAWEHAAARVSVFDANGEFGRVVTLHRAPGAYPQAIGRFGDGRVVASHINEPAPGVLGSVVRDTARFVWYSLDGSAWHEIANLPNLDWITTEFAIMGQTRRIVGRPPFSRLGATAARGDRFYYGSSDRYEIAVYSPDGAVRGLIRRVEDDRALSPEMIDAYVEQRMQEAPDDPAGRREWQRAFDEIPWPDSVPAYRRLRVDKADNLWVQRYSLPGDTAADWSIFGPDGVWRAAVAIPMDLEVFEIGEDYILALWRDEQDVEYVRQYELITPER